MEQRGATLGDCTERETDRTQSWYEALSEYWQYSLAEEKWISTTQLDSDECSVSVMTYNILSPTILDKHKHLYPNCQPKYMSWAYRCGQILKQIILHCCDVICLQEVEEECLVRDLAPPLARLGYEYRFMGRGGDKPDGCVVFWKTSTLFKQSYTPVQMFVGCHPMLNRHNVGMVLKFHSRKQRDVEFCVATTHLLYNPRRGEVKLAQLRTFMASVDECAYLGKSKLTGNDVYMPTVVCGDLNTGHNTPLYRFIVEGRLNLKGKYCAEIGLPPSAGKSGPKVREDQVHLGSLTPSTQYAADAMSRYGNEEVVSVLMHAKLDDPVSLAMGAFRSCYSHFRGEEPEATMCVEDVASNVDYIFYNNTPWLRHVGSLKLRSEQEIRSFGPIPNAFMGSDHLPLAAKFIVKPVPDNVF